MLISVLLVAPAIVAASEPASSPTTDGPEVAVSKNIVPYVGFSGGGGGGWVTIDGATNRNVGVLLGARVGAAITPKFTLDLNATGFAINESYSFPRADPASVIRLFNVYVAATFPIQDFLLRGGIGGGWLSATNGFDAPPSPWSASGLALVGGLGYRMWASETAAFSFNVEGLFHSYGTSAWKSEAVVCSLGFDVYFRRAR